MTQPLSARARIIVTGSDQLLSSLQNFGLLVLAARQLSATSFGAFSLVFTMVTLLITLSRGAVSEPILLAFAARSNRDQREVQPIGVTLILLTGLTVAAIAAGVALAFPPLLRGPLEAMAICVPGLLLFDLQRYLAVTRKLSVALLSMDVAWVAVWLVAVVVVRPKTGSGELLLWGLAASVVGVGVLLVTRVRPAPVGSAARTWWIDHRRNAGSLVGEYAALNTGQQISAILVTAFLGYSATGGFRGAQTLFNPITTLTQTSRVAVVPEVIRSGGSRTQRGKRLLLGTTAVGVLLSAGVLAVFYVIPDSVGRALLGATWPQAHRLLLAVGTRSILTAMALRATLAMRADLRLRGIATYRTINAVSSTAVICVFAATTSVRTTAWSITAVAAFTLLVAEGLERKWAPAATTDRVAAVEDQRLTLARDMIFLSPMALRPARHVVPPFATYADVGPSDQT